MPRSTLWNGMVCYPSSHPAWICVCFVLLLLNVYHQAAEIVRTNNESCKFATLLLLSMIPDYSSHIFPLILIITQCGKKLASIFSWKNQAKWVKIPVNT